MKVFIFHSYGQFFNSFLVQAKDRVSHPLWHRNEPHAKCRVMSIWIPVTLFAAFMQNLRFMLQRHLKTTSLSTGGATFSRFLFSAPLVVLIVFIYGYVREFDVPALTPRFWMFALSGGVAQILGTACVIALFGTRNFSVGIVFKKTEVVQTALIGLIILGEGISLWGVVAVAIGFFGMVILSDPPERTSVTTMRERFFNQAAGFGLASGAMFGASAIGYRGATLELVSTDILFRAGLTLAMVTSFQTVLMLVWLAIKERDEIRRVVASWRVSSLVGITSMCGSFGWFVAFSLQNAAYVKALGQVELIFTFLGSYFVFKERSNRREMIGIALIVLSILFLVTTL